MPLVLASQAVSEEGALPKCFHQRGKLGIGAPAGSAPSHPQGSA
jgi:hypothetical protein